MNALKCIAATVLIGALSACAVPPSDTVPLGDSRITAKQPLQEPAEQALPLFRINEINVRVPKSLRVSERNTYYPGGDIVWREDPIGNRHAQVKAIFETAFVRGAEDINGLTPVDVEVEVERFHALTERARYTIGGVHAITFLLQFRDPETGLALSEPKRVHADLQAFGGLAAIRAENQGITQKSRITAHLAEVLRQEMQTHEGHKNAELGLYQVINKL